MSELKWHGMRICNILRGKQYELLVKILYYLISFFVITSHHITSHHITSHHITPPSHHITSHHITSRHITSHHITSHHTTITSHHITSHHTTSHHITSHHITSHYITSHHITSHHITSYVPGSFSFFVLVGYGGGVDVRCFEHYQFPSAPSRLGYLGKPETYARTQKQISESTECVGGYHGQEAHTHTYTHMQINAIP